MKNFKEMNAEELRAAYDNTAAVPDFPAVLAGMQARSQTFYKQHLSGEKGVPYAPGKRTKLDYIPANAERSPAFIFIHGGYWHACTKEDFAFIAKGPLSLGCHVFLLEYTLAPEATMTQIVEEIGMALDFIDGHVNRYNIERGKVCLSGHSAGGHLTAIHRTHPLISCAMPISPLVDLEPIQLSWLGDILHLTPEEIAAFSPIHQVRKGVPTDVFVGEAELPELVRHARSYYQALVGCDNPAQLFEPIGHTHFSILDELASTSGVLVSALDALLCQKKAV